MPRVHPQGIILPLVGPLAKNIGGGDARFLSHCIGSVLGGALFGNICSPISDTTILTVLSTKCDLQAHVATITPFAAIGAAAALLLGSLPVGLGLYGPFTALLLSTAAIYGTLLLLGAPPDGQPGWQVLAAVVKQKLDERRSRVARGRRLR